jgi:hypothetical protein
MDSKLEKPIKRLPPNAGKGRPKGVPNRATKAFRDTVQRLLEDNSENVSKWLQTVAEGDPENEIKPDPGKALGLLKDLAEYATPKLARQENVGDGGGPMVVEIVRFGKD